MESPGKPLAGRSAVITGANQGLGRAIAEHFVRAGGAIMVRELDLAEVPELVRSLLDDPARLHRMGEAMLRVARPDAADQIADELVRLAEGAR